MDQIQPARVYRASKTLTAFHRSDEFVRGVVGPIGSGKSVGCLWEGVRRTAEQRPSPDGTAYVRGAIVRNTYRELQDTVLPTWQQWFPDLGRWRPSDNLIQIRTRGLHADILFRALDTIQDVRKLLSLELTWAFVNEAREVPGAVIDMLGGRVGRYPSKEQGGPTWFGTWCDTNPPDELNWWYRQFEEARPAGWRVFHQPSGLGPDAENVENLPPRYYERLCAGKTDAWIKVYAHGQYGFVAEDGRPMFPEYIDTLHCRHLPQPEGGTVYVGLDFGLTPAATFGYRSITGQMRIIDEIVTEDMGAAKFSRLVSQKLRERFPSPAWQCVIKGDPSGDQRSPTDEELTPFIVLRQAGVPASPAYTNDPIVRRDAVGLALRSMDMMGEPLLLIDPACLYLRRALNGGYRIKRMAVPGEERFADKPDKNMSSHIAESLEYLMLGAGEGHNVIQGGQTQWATQFPKDKRQARRPRG